MGPIAYALCQKPVVGLVMFVSSLCVFPPLVFEKAVPLAVAGSTVATAISVPVDKSYFLELNFQFSNADAARRDVILGSRYDKHCEQGEQDQHLAMADIPGSGRAIPLRVTVRRKSDNAVVAGRTFVSRCFSSNSELRATKSRLLGAIPLNRGEYMLEVTNLEAQAGLEEVTASFSLVAGYGK